jgi:hypothetical protein
MLMKCDPQCPHCVFYVNFSPVEIPPPLLKKGDLRVIIISQSPSVAYYYDCYLPCVEKGDGDSSKLRSLLYQTEGISPEQQAIPSLLHQRIGELLKSERPELAKDDEVVQVLKTGLLDRSFWTFEIKYPTDTPRIEDVKAGQSLFLDGPAGLRELIGEGGKVVMVPLGDTAREFIGRWVDNNKHDLGREISVRGLEPPGEGAGYYAAPHCHSRLKNGRTTLEEVTDLLQTLQKGLKEEN